MDSLYPSAGECVEWSGDRRAIPSGRGARPRWDRSGPRRLRPSPGSSGRREAPAGGGGCRPRHPFDGTYTESLTLEQARRNDVIVAYEFEGSPLSSEHGGPGSAFYMAPMYGYKSIKWLDTIELTKTVQPGYWEKLGYDVDGWVGRSNGRDDQPT